MDMENELHHTSTTPRDFTFHLLERITNNFSKDRIIGYGGCGVVYKGVLDNGEEIAVKKLYYNHPELDDDKQFRNECITLMRVQHQNIVRLVGYCYEIAHKVVKYNGEYVFARVEERALCFEYLQCGSLDNHLSDESCGLGWRTRYNIIQGICKGLHYLHNGSQDPIYHLDLKPANILLDQNMMPKIGDFGLSRLFDSTQTHTTGGIRGTPGYMPPEFVDRFQITPKFDVFSLGVTIIQIMTGREGYSKCGDMPSQEFIDLVHGNWLKTLQETRSSPIAFEVKTCIEIALRCVEVDRVKRPTITDIVDELSKVDIAKRSFIVQVANSQSKQALNHYASSSGAADAESALTAICSPRIKYGDEGTSMGTNVQAWVQQEVLEEDPAECYKTQDHDRGCGGTLDKLLAATKRKKDKLLSALAGMWPTLSRPRPSASRPRPSAARHRPSAYGGGDGGGGGGGGAGGGDVECGFDSVAVSETCKPQTWDEFAKKEKYGDLPTYVYHQAEDKVTSTGTKVQGAADSLAAVSNSNTIKYGAFIGELLDLVEATDRQPATDDEIFSAVAVRWPTWIAASEGRDGLLWWHDLVPCQAGDLSVAGLQANYLLEDQCCVESASPLGTIIGIFDGHGGPDAARFACESLLPGLQEAMSGPRGMTADAIRRAFLAMEEGFIALVSRLWETKPSLAVVGSCCLVGVVCQGTLFVANLGDSRAVLGKAGNDGQIIAEQLSSEHNVRDEDVRKELMAQHPDDPHIVVLKHNVWRVKGIIQVSRSIGDAYLKHQQFNCESLHGNFRVGEPFSRPILSASPSIVSRSLQPSDRFIIFASDGLWEHLSNEEVVEIVRTHGRDRITRRLIEAAFRVAAEKRDMRYSDLLMIDKGVRRHFHDDITVVVLFIDHDLSAEDHGQARRTVSISTSQELSQL